MENSRLGKKVGVTRKRLVFSSFFAGFAVHIPKYSEDPMALIVSMVNTVVLVDLYLDILKRKKQIGEAAKTRTEEFFEIFRFPVMLLGILITVHGVG